jgi:hypothetical protein
MSDKRKGKQLSNKQHMMRWHMDSAKLKETGISYMPSENLNRATCCFEAQNFEQSKHTIIYWDCVHLRWVEWIEKHSELVDGLYAKKDEDETFVFANDTGYEMFRCPANKEERLAKMQMPSHYFIEGEHKDAYVLKNLKTNYEYFIRFNDKSNGLSHGLKEWFARYRPDEAPGILLEFVFPQDFPSGPPFVRVIRPRFQQWTGHITIGGSICTPMFTISDSTGSWQSDYKAEGVLQFLQQLFSDGGARVDMQNGYDYTEREAQEAFNRVNRDHGWNNKSV